MADKATIFTEDEAARVRELVASGIPYAKAVQLVKGVAGLNHFGFNGPIRQQEELRRRAQPARAPPPAPRPHPAQQRIGEAPFTQRRLTPGRPGRPLSPTWEHPPAAWKVDEGELRAIRDKVLRVRTDDDADRFLREVEPLIAREVQEPNPDMSHVNAWQWGVVLVNEWLYGEVTPKERFRDIAARDRRR